MIENIKNVKKVGKDTLHENIIAKKLLEFFSSIQKHTQTMSINISFISLAY